MEINGTLNTRDIVIINTDNDNVLTFQNSDNSWQYISFYTNNTRKIWMGIDPDNNFNISKENGGNIVLSGGNIELKGGKVLYTRHIDGFTVDGTAADHLYLNYVGGNDVQIGRFSSDPAFRNPICMLTGAWAWEQMRRRRMYTLKIT